jgi:hypothetical protein
LELHHRLNKKKHQNRGKNCKGEAILFARSQSHQNIASSCFTIFEEDKALPKSHFSSIVCGEAKVLATRPSNLTAISFVNYVILSSQLTLKHTQNTLY